jgi:opacity protein-like surface antigen
MYTRRLAFAFAIIAALTWSAGTAHAVDEIQVYNGELAKPGQFSLEKHFNYAFNGRKEPDFPGGLVPNRALNGTPELAYGVNNWYELGLYLPYAIDQSGNAYSNGFKIRHLFAVPDAGKREFFYGVNFEFSYANTRKFSDTRFASEIRPIIGVRKGDYEFILNPIVDVGFGRNGEVEFLPAARIARRFGEDFSLGVEYYTALGPFRGFLPFEEQQHNIYGVIDFRVGRFEINAGLGYGLTGGSDRLIAKLIVGTDLN